MIVGWDVGAGVRGWAANGTQHASVPCVCVSAQEHAGVLSAGPATRRGAPMAPAAMTGFPARILSHAVPTRLQVPALPGERAGGGG